jgi:molecular chaperone GrpE
MTEEQKATREATQENPEQAENTVEATDQSEAPETTPSDAEVIAQLREEVTAAKAKADEYLDKWQRAAADFQNSRRRLEAQLNEEVERANAGLILRLIPVLDDLELAFKNVPAELQNGENGAQVAWLNGFRQIRKKLMDTLADFGVERVDTQGEFDPARHEAIGSEAHEGVQSGHIVEELRAGYVYRGRVLRPALVRVAL